MHDFEVIRTGEGESDWKVRKIDHPLGEVIKMDDLYWFLDHWLITNGRKNGDTILNGTPEEFEKQLRELINGKEKD